MVINASSIAESEHQDNLPWNHLSFLSLLMKFCNSQFKIDLSFIYQAPQFIQQW